MTRLAIPAPAIPAKSNTLIGQRILFIPVVVLLAWLLGGCTGEVSSDTPIIETDASLSKPNTDDAGVDDSEGEQSNTPKTGEEADRDNQTNNGESVVDGIVKVPGQINDGTTEIVFETDEPSAIQIAAEKLIATGSKHVPIATADGKTDRILGVSSEGDLWVYTAEDTIETHSFHTRSGPSGESQTYSAALLEGIVPGYSDEEDNSGRTTEPTHPGELLNHVTVDGLDSATLISANQIWRATSGTSVALETTPLPDNLTVVLGHCGGKKLNQTSIIWGLVCTAANGCTQGETLTYDDLEFALYERRYLDSSTVDSDRSVWVRVKFGEIDANDLTSASSLLRQSFNTIRATAQVPDGNLATAHLAGACLSDNSPFLIRTPDAKLHRIQMTSEGYIQNISTVNEDKASGVRLFETSLKFNKTFAVDEHAGMIAIADLPKSNSANAPTEQKVVLQRFEGNKFFTHRGHFPQGKVSHVAAGGGYIFAAVGAKLFRKGKGGQWNTWEEIQTGVPGNIAGLWGTATGQVWMKSGTNFVAVNVRDNAQQDTSLTVSGITPYSRFYPGEISFNIDVISNESDRLIHNVELYVDSSTTYLTHVTNESANPHAPINLTAANTADNAVLNTPGWHTLTVRASYDANDADDVYERHFPFRVIGEIETESTTVTDPSTDPEPDPLVTFAEVTAIAVGNGSNGTCMTCHNGENSARKNLTNQANWLDLTTATEIKRRLESEDTSVTMPPSGGLSPAQRILLIKFVQQTIAGEND